MNRYNLGNPREMTIKQFAAGIIRSVAPIS